MYNTTYPHPTAGTPGFLKRIEIWLDQRGKPAWLAAMILSFIFVWPLGLAILAYMIWSKRMFSKMGCAHRRHHHENHRAFNTSGNSAFDAYKAETLRRLEDEQQAFESFLQRLRDAKDKSEFDDFMENRAKTAAAPVMENTPVEQSQPGAY